MELWEWMEEIWFDAYSTVEVEGGATAVAQHWSPEGMYLFVVERVVWW